MGRSQMRLPKHDELVIARRPAVSHAPQPATSPVVQLQRYIGNSGVQRLLQSPAGMSAIQRFDDSFWADYGPTGGSGMPGGEWQPEGGGGTDMPGGEWQPGTGGGGGGTGAPTGGWQPGTGGGGGGGTGMPSGGWQPGGGGGGGGYAQEQPGAGGGGGGLCPCAGGQYEAGPGNIW